MGVPGALTQQNIQAPPKIKYVLYARKSTESEERQVLSIDSQIQEMLKTAEKDGLEIIDIRRESHSAKDSGQRPVFNEILNDIKIGKFNGILTWAPDRLSRNAGDLGSLVDLMDQKLADGLRNLRIGNKRVREIQKTKKRYGLKIYLLRMHEKQNCDQKKNP